MLDTCCITSPAEFVEEKHCRQRESSSNKTKQLEDMRHRATDVAHPTVKSKRMTIGRTPSSAKEFRIVPAAVNRSHSCRLSRIALVCNQTTAQLKDSVYNLHLEHLTSQELSTSFRSEFDQKIKSLELSVEDLCESNITMVNNQWRQHLYLLKKGDKVKTGLSSELTSTRLMLLDEVQKSSSEINSSLASLSSQLAEVVALLKGLVIPKRGKVAAVSRKWESSSDDRIRDSSSKHRWF
ncbi:hypothetical protein F511_17772 [Dorcoceras hygrometricum]|uniref:Uncharacterized protein n=1 Tax=Dorcoceras hygrometricum TaxID=472368 RepID=A0A2Z7ANF0_9LAMI|nr:hypothetical protein F511_17772 [Dorcoceras hygrometricum]